MPQTTKSFTRICLVGRSEAGRVFVTIQWDGRKLSFSGVEGPLSNGDARGSCGQTRVKDLEEVFTSDGWTAEMVSKLNEYWDRWHGNHARAGCEHQRAWDTAAELELVELTWGPKFHSMRKLAEDGKLTPTEYGAYRYLVPKVYRLTIDDPCPKHPDLFGEDAELLLAGGYVKEHKREKKAAGWVRPQEHTGGLLTKPCPECGHKYGSAWLYEEVPQEVLTWLRALPDATEEMPSCWRR